MTPLPFANPLRRLCAYWIDITLLYSVTLSVQFTLGFVTNWAIQRWLAQSTQPLLTFAWIFLTVSLPMWLYFIWGESSAHQATIGKRWLGLKVTDLQGTQLDRRRATLRTILKLGYFEIGHLSFLLPTPLFEEVDPALRLGFIVLLALMGLYLVTMFITPRRQSIHDLLSNTIVQPTT